MDIAKYEKIVKNNTPKESIVKNSLVSFFVGGIMGLIGQGLYDFYYYVLEFSKKDSVTLMIITVILVACILTAIGVLDRLVKTFKCGLILPISGFAHSVCSAMIDYKHEGYITGIGANCFKLAGSVILYAVVSGFLVGLISYIVVNI